MLPSLNGLDLRQRGAIDVTLEAWLQTPKMREAGSAGERIVKTGLLPAAHWTVAQLVAHQTMNGCNLMPGDLLGTGTLSDEGPGGQACFLELTEGGRKPVHLSNGEERYFLLDGDTVTLRGYCEREGYRRIGFGECKGTVVAGHRG